MSLWDESALSLDVDETTSGLLNPYSNRKVRVFQFPIDEKEKELWIASLPNFGLSGDNISKNMGVCELHWPKNYSTKKSRRWKVPTNPPSVFDVPASCSRQTAPTKLREVLERVVSADSRAIAAEQRQLESAQELDQIRSWDNLISHCQSLGLFNHENQTGITIFSLHEPQNQPPSISFSINIAFDFKVICFKNQTKVPIRDVLGFTCKLERFSQLESIIDFVSNFELTFQAEIVSISQKVREICESVSDEYQKRRILFLARQLELCLYSENGRRYLPSDFKYAIELFLRSRNCYTGLRDIFVLPHPKTIKSLFGKLSDPGSIQECQEIVKSVFLNLNGPQKYCKILLDFLTHLFDIVETTLLVKRLMSTNPLERCWH